VNAEEKLKSAHYKLRGAIKMKKFIIGFTVFALVAIGTIFAFAQKGEVGGKRSGRGFGGHHRGGFGRLAEKLNLTDAQKEQVKQITEASRAKIKPLMESARANHQKIETLTANGQFDEAQVQAVAQEQAQISAQLIVEKARVKSQIFQILTDEQKAQAMQMQEQMKNRMQERFKNKRQRKADKVNGDDM
jgi:Spy/CpxP family protein refolding chaperone